MCGRLSGKLHKVVPRHYSGEVSQVSSNSVHQKLLKSVNFFPPTYEKGTFFGDTVWIETELARARELLLSLVPF